MLEIGTDWPIASRLASSFTRLGVY
jgi:hypothetical protein